MDEFTPVLALAGALGSGLIAGVFFAFSSFVMPALGRLPAEAGQSAMQSINVAVLRPSFLGVFVGTALLSLAAAGLGVWRWSDPGMPWLVAGGSSYFLGTFLVTGLKNVPLNDRLAAQTPGEDGAPAVWQHYLRRWTTWNHLRTLAAVLAALAFMLALRALPS